MVRVGLVSDSWGDAPRLARALVGMERAGAERLFFLGGRWGDVDAALSPALVGAAVDRLRPRLVRVASRKCAEALAAGAELKLIEMIGGALGYAVHDKADLTRDDIASATFLLHGAAAAPGVVRIGPRFFVTPGRLAAPDGGHAGAPGTWALLEVDAARLELVVFGDDGQERSRLAEQIPSGAGVKVR